MSMKYPRRKQTAELHNEIVDRFDELSKIKVDVKRKFGKKYKSNLSINSIYDILSKEFKKSLTTLERIIKAGKYDLSKYTQNE